MQEACHLIKATDGAILLTNPGTDQLVTVRTFGDQFARLPAFSRGAGIVYTDMTGDSPGRQCRALLGRRA